MVSASTYRSNYYRPPPAQAHAHPAHAQAQAQLCPPPLPLRYELLDGGGGGLVTLVTRLVKAPRSPRTFVEKP